ncbi:gamma-glutamylcyclotransferase [Paenirhodobacter populi]|uniref:gamma-glutamylcyclotransferase n=1 Tax=Paenirhodobacter populi TaxID=2306993 RepID=UPI000FE3D2C6|nr:gamma-glutamylcyclotransferase [Sinirhodobacter populi]RWR10132.1 gamma-glutamylcyclotransferase [Sinirhodobacter populi]
MTRPLWIFGYGSLIWDPGFAPAETRRARLPGWRRSFCMRSICFRGTPEAPGLVLALDHDPAAECSGLVFRVHDDEAEPVLRELRARELVTNAYLERRLPVLCEDGETVAAITYVIDPEGPQYCALPDEEQARIIAGATGSRGPNRDYLWNTALHLRGHGLSDPWLETLSGRVEELCR